MILGPKHAALGMGATCVAAAAGWLVSTRPDPTLAMVGVLALTVIMRATPASASKVLLTTYFGMVALPVIPGFHDQNSAQVLTLTVIAITGYVNAGILAHRRGVRPGLAMWVSGVLVVLSFMSVGLIARNDGQLLFGILTAAVLGVSILCGRIATDLEHRRTLIGVTLFAHLMAVIAIWESLVGHPIYEFTPFQVTASSLSAFRASALLGHPLVLATVLVTVAILNLARPLGRFPGTMRYRWLSAALPLAGAAASVSRSTVLYTLVGVLIIAMSRRRPAGERSGRGLAGVVLTVTVGLAILAFQAPGSALGSRLAELTTREQSVRLGALDVVREITTGHEMIIGGGPHSVAAAFAAGSERAQFGTSDNQLLTAYADYGVIGAIGLGALVVLVVSGIRRRSIGAWQQTMVIGAMIPVVSMLVFDPLAWPAVAVLLGYGIGASWPSTIPVRSQTAVADDTSYGLGVADHQHSQHDGLAKRI